MSGEKVITHSAGKIAAGTAVSRVLGYIRDMLVAHAFGAGLFADAFYAAYRIPNLLRRLLGEGSLSASFIPVLSQYLHTKSKEETQELIDTVFTVLTTVLVIITALGVLFAPQLVKLIAYGFASDPEKLALTVELTRLMFPFILFICLAALVLGILNTLSSFFIPAVASASLSIAEIGYVLAVAPLLAPGNQIKGLAISVIVGGLGQFAVQWPKLRSLGWSLSWRFNLNHPGLRRIGLLMIPSMIGLSVDQINAFVNTICASFLEQGSITALYYSNRLMQLPLAIFGIALASAALPAMSKSVAEKNIDAVKETINYSARVIIYVLTPAAVGLMVLGLPSISVLFERGEFDRHASLITNSALFYYSLGLPAYAITKVLASAFYSFQETKTPVKVAVAAMLLNIVLMLLFMKPMGVGGLALATALASYFNALVLAYVLRKKIGKLGIKQIAYVSAKVSVASVLMGAVCYMTNLYVFRSMPIFSLAFSIGAGLAVYFGISVLLKIEERKPLLAIIMRDKPTVED